MAYTQFDIDQQQFQRRQNTLGKIGDGIQQGIVQFQENRRRALDDRNKQLENDIQLSQAGATPEDIKSYRESGDPANILSKYAEVAKQAKQKKLEQDNLDKKLKESQINKNNRYKQSSSNVNNDYDPNTPFEDSKAGKIYAGKQKIKAREQDNQKIDQAKIPDFDFADPTIIPSQKDAEEVKN
jgi:hypothetical protein